MSSGKSSGGGNAKLALRDYQTEALEAVKTAYRAGKRRILVSLPTGTGKTVVFAHFPTALRMKKRLMILAHREELLQQAADKFRMLDPSLKVGIERAESSAQADARVVIASVPTLGRGKGDRLARFSPDDFSIVVVDEAHHAVAASYRQIFNHFGLFEPGTPRLLVGFTATPRRGDKQGLGEVFEDVCYARDLRQMIDASYLCHIRGWRVASDLWLDGVQTRHGDFVESQLARAVNTPVRNTLLTTAYLRLASYRRAIVFCADVQHSKDVRDAFIQAGVRAEAVWGELPRDERREVLGRFSRGETSVLTNCNLLTEGFDEPRINCVIMARPTQSKLLYAQMVGRGTRLHSEKKDLMVVDVVDNSRTHTLPSLQSLFNLPRNLDLEGRRALDIEREVERLVSQFPWIDTSRLHSSSEIPLAAQRIEFFAFDPPAELEPHTSHTWYGTADSYRLSLPNGEFLTIESNLLDAWDVRLASREEVRLLAHADTLTRAVAIADTFVSAERPDAAKLVQRTAGWRAQRPTEKQLELLKQRGIPIPDGLTKGQASQMISLMFAPARRPVKGKGS